VDLKARTPNVAASLGDAPNRAPPRWHFLFVIDVLIRFSNTVAKSCFPVLDNRAKFLDFLQCQEQRIPYGRIGAKSFILKTMRPTEYGGANDAWCENVRLKGCRKFDLRRNSPYWPFKIKNFCRVEKGRVAVMVC